MRLISINKIIDTRKKSNIWFTSLVSLILAGLVVFAFSPAFAYASNQSSRVKAITNVKTVPVIGQPLESGTIIIKDGYIAEIGPNLSIPPEAEIIDAKGLTAYPGMIDSYSSLGLVEISGVAATVDNRETGRINPQVKAIEALRYDSMHIPITRANGIVAALVAPSGGLIAGQSTLIKLSGWTNRQMAIKESLAMIVELPQIRSGRRSFRGFGGQQPEVTTDKALDELRELFHQARMYEKRRQVAHNNLLLPLPEFDETSHSLLPVVKGELPVIFLVHAAQDITKLIKFVKEEKIKAIFYGVEQGFMVAKEIKEAGIPCLIGSLYGLPPVWEDGYDSLFLNPVILNQAGVKIAFSSSSSSLAKDLPYHAAKAAAFGLDRTEALKAVTIYPAEIFGVDNLMGSLETGKLANIVLADGDILELGTKIEKVFIEGNEMDLRNRYTELLEKFQQREKEKSL